MRNNLNVPGYSKRHGGDNYRQDCRIPAAGILRYNLPRARFRLADNVHRWRRAQRAACIAFGLEAQRSLSRNFSFCDD